jgi:chemotaxis protein MotB
MKSTVSGVLATALLAGLTVAGGCVSRQEYERVHDLNRRAHEQLSELREKNHQLQNKNDQLLVQLQNKEQALLRQQEIATRTEEARQELEKRFEEMNRRYKELITGTTPPSVGSIRVLPAQLDRALQAFAKENPDLVEYYPKRGMLKFKSDLTFEKGSDFVNDQAKKALQAFAKVATGDIASKFNIYVAGHTDNIPVRKPSTRRVHPNNWYLSVHRAVSVKDVLAKAGVDADRIGVMGFGEHHPIAPNKANEGGNPLNRRVELWIVPPDQFLTTPADIATREAEEETDPEAK